MRVSAVAVLLVVGVTSMPAMAYIDPASGSAIMSAIIGFFVAISLAVKTYWYRIKAFFSGSKSDTSVDTQDQEKAEPLEKLD